MRKVDKNRETIEEFKDVDQSLLEEYGNVEEGSTSSGDYMTESDYYWRVLLQSCKRTFFYL